MTEIRNAQPGDAHAIAEVQVESWQAAYHGLLPDSVLANLSIPDSERFWSTILVDPPPRTAMLLAISDTIVLGFVTLGPDQDSAAVSGGGQLYAIYLRPDQRGHGIGVQLHNAAMDRLMTLGFRHVVVWVLEGNEPALRFYHRNGWAADGARQIEQGRHGVDLPVLRLRRALPAI